MARFAANLSFLFKELPFMERFAAAKEAGFEAVEVLFPYEEPASEIARLCHELGLTMALINAPPPNYAGGDRGFAAVPGLEERFQRDFKRALRVAQFLEAKHLHIMSGRAQGLAAAETFKRNLAWAAREAPTQSLTIEPINGIDMPGYFLNNFDLASEIIDTVGAPNLGLQFDAYHAHILTGDVPSTFETHAHRVRHIQIASAPDRQEPNKGDIDYPAFFQMLDEIGYRGFVSAEYNPKDRTSEGLDWLRAAQKENAPLS